MVEWVCVVRVIVLGGLLLILSISYIVNFNVPKMGLFTDKFA